jgi:diaminohydroxyphosphoribosylaminopyrimidine deaminase/5-amino-6-(5-phosphoribosylamino)uracil reductase
MIGNHFNLADHQYMARAIQLARKGRFTTSPNPNVGCVLVRDGKVVGEGYHLQAGGPHAERHALTAAGGRAQGATCFVTLEPCSHHGRTPPCAEGLIEHGVAEVVVAMVDPNPEVAGKGIKLLQDAGIKVWLGLLAEQARALNPGFIKRMRTGLPYVRVKLAASLDGRTALANGESKWITSPQARRDVQKFRAQAGAILSGSNTVLADDPSLNVRTEQLTGLAYPLSTIRQPVRVLIDGQARLTPTLKTFSLPGEVWVAREEGSAKENWSANTTQLSIPRSGANLDLEALLRELARREINDVWLEAGAELAGAFLQQGLADDLILYLAPKLMGNLASGLVSLPAFSNMQEVLGMSITDTRMVGPDLRIIASLARLRSQTTTGSGVVL